jgi:Cu(I)/Ag(I) efflux system membrane fusion protein
MHPQIMESKSGDCPICGMHLVWKSTGLHTDQNQPSVPNDQNRQIGTILPETTMQPGEFKPTVTAIGTTAYNTSDIGVISARTSGRIEKMYVRYRFQSIVKGQKIMDVFSPELLQAQQNTILLLRTDPENAALIYASKARLERLGMTSEQVEALILSGQPSPLIAIYSPYEGHIHEAGLREQMGSDANAMPDDQGKITPELNLKEGMYIQAGQPILTVYNTKNLWAVLNIQAAQYPLVKKGAMAGIVVETDPDKTLHAPIDFVEPFFRTGSKTLTVRAILANAEHRIPVGARLRATIETATVQGNWLPRTAVLSLGLTQVAMRKAGDIYEAVQVTTGLLTEDKIQILDGLSMQDSVAVNAQFLIDSESFIKTGKQQGLRQHINSN